MKNLLLLSIIICTLTNTAFAKIWRVNNNPDATANFTSAQQAHDDNAVNAGDSLYFEHSAASYGNLLMTKGLKLIGLGAFLSQNPGLQYNLNSSYLGNITLRPTATNAQISVNCLIVYDSADGLKILRCQTSNITFVGAKNCTVANSFITSITMKARFFTAPSCQVLGCTGMSIYNNICQGSITQDAIAYLPYQHGGCGTEWIMPNSAVVANNSISTLIQIKGYVYNNIVGSINTDGSTIVTNNIFFGPQSNSVRTVFLPGSNSSSSILESGNSNQFSVPFTGIYSSLNPSSYDTAWHLNPTSVAKGAGTGGVDCGATGGGTPYLFGAQPAIPAIYKLNVAPAPTGNSIGVTISTRSNN